MKWVYFQTIEKIIWKKLQIVQSNSFLWWHYFCYHYIQDSKLNKCYKSQAVIPINKLCQNIPHHSQLAITALIRLRFILVPVKVESNSIFFHGDSLLISFLRSAIFSSLKETSLLVHLKCVHVPCPRLLNPSSPSLISAALHCSAALFALWPASPSSLCPAHTIFSAMMQNLLRHLQAYISPAPRLFWGAILQRLHLSWSERVSSYSGTQGRGCIWGIWSTLHTVRLTRENSFVF